MDRAKIVYPQQFLQSRCIIKVLEANFNILFLKLEVDKTWLSQYTNYKIFFIKVQALECHKTKT